MGHDEKLCGMQGTYKLKVGLVDVVVTNFFFMAARVSLTEVTECYKKPEGSRSP